MSNLGSLPNGHSSHSHSHSHSHGRSQSHSHRHVRRPTGHEHIPHDPTDIFNASSIAEIHATLAHLNEQEVSVTARLDSLISNQKDLSRELGRLDLLRAHLGSQVITTRTISHGMLSDAATTANRISGAVKRLDLEQSRVKATLTVVEQVADLKACVQGVTGAMGGAQDWEKAAGYLSRASKIPDEILKGAFADEIVPTAEIPDPPSVTLNNAAESLCGLFLREFEKAAKEGDGAKVTRFFKLFPLISRSDVGLDVYGRYVCQGVASRARTNLNAGTGANQRKEGYFYANALTKLFEHIAQIVDGHGGLVERHYGVGRMIKVIERLQVEADIQGGIILDTWADERSIDRRLTDIKSYAFSFLVQSFLSVPKTSSGTPRAGSPAIRDGSGSSGKPASGEEEDGVDMKEVDGLLSETAMMLGRWSLYCRFLANKCAPPPEPTPTEDEPPPPLSMPSLLSDSNLHKKVAARLINPFNAMTTFFFRRSVEKAFQLDEPPTGLHLNPNKPLDASTSAPYITSCVDDVMFIVSKVLQRSVATSQRAVVAGVVPTIGRVLGSDFVGMIQRKMRDESYPKAVIQGGYPPEDKIVAFLVLINNLDVATDYIARIVSSHTSTTPTTPGTSLPDLYPFQQDATLVHTTLTSLQSTFLSKTSELISDGLHVAFDRVIKPKLRPILADAFRDADYLLTEAELAELSLSPDGLVDDDADDATSASPVAGRFQPAWDALMHPISLLLTPQNYTKLLSSTATYLATKLLEKRLWSLHGRINELGAVRLERDVAGIVGAVVRGGKAGGYGLRERFARCTQICWVVNMEADEWEDLDGADAGVAGVEDGGEDGEGVDWKLDKAERRRARAMLVVGRE